MTLSILMNLKTRQVDYTNAFAQAELDSNEHVYVELPRDFEANTVDDVVLKMRTSLYGMRQSPKMFYDKLRLNLLKRNFVESQIDSCLFIHEKMVCIFYVDDCLFFCKTRKNIEDLI